MYQLKINDELVGQGLSRGELNQWLIDLDNELKEMEKQNFREDLNLNNVEIDNFENFIYNIEINDISARFGNKILEIYYM